MEAGPPPAGNFPVLVTGAAGFIGRALCPQLTAAGYQVRAAVRSAARAIDATSVAVGEIDGATDWSNAVAGIECVIHLAGRAHALQDGSRSFAEYRRINVEGTRRLAQEAARSGVKRLVFVSSVKVNGESTAAAPFVESDPPRPEDAYGVSKWEAEQALLQVANASRLEAVVLRPPLVYGPGVKGNFLRLAEFIMRGFPLPLASVHNRRSLIHVGNLAAAIVACQRAPRAAGRTYLVSDGEDVSTPALIGALAAALGVRARLIPFPVPLLRFAATVLGRSGEIARLTESLQIDSSRIRYELGWRPPHSLADGLHETARWLLSEVGRLGKPL
jgi:nucleoside-diphosphate-sugar epimerase